MKVGVIGCGKQAWKHVRALKAFHDVQLVVSDKDMPLAKDFASTFNIQYFTDIFTCCPDMEAVVICTPVETHPPLIQRALSCGLHVFCEKPLCKTLSQAREIEAAMLQSNRWVQVGFVYRYAPVFEEAKRLLHEGIVLGKPLVAFFRLGGRGSHQEWKHKKGTGGGAINEMMVHMLDLALWFFGPMQLELSEVDIYLPSRKLGGANIECDAEDFVFAKFESPTVDVFIQADFVTPAFSQYVEIQGENGSFFGSIQPDVPSYLYLQEARGGYEQGKTVFNFGKRNFFDAQMTDFVYCLITKTPPTKNTIQDSIQLMEHVEGIKQ